MVQIKKQMPPQPPQLEAPPLDGDDPLSGAVAVTRLECLHQKFVLYGANRCGKTTLACEWPKPLLLVSFEPNKAHGGAQSVSRTPGVTYITVRSKAHAVNLARRLATDRRSNWRRDDKGAWRELTDKLGRPVFQGEPFATDALDTCTSLQDVILAELMGLANAPVQLGWGTVPEDVYKERSEQAKEVMREWIGLPANTLLIAQERDHNPPKDDKGRAKPRLMREYEAGESGLQLGSFLSADLGQGTVKWMRDAADYIAHLSIVKETKVVRVQAPEIAGVKGQDYDEEQPTGRKVRRLRTILDMGYDAGFRSASPEAVPEWIQCGTPAEMYQAVSDVIAGKRTKHGKYQK